MKMLDETISRGKKQRLKKRIAQLLGKEIPEKPQKKEPRVDVGSLLEQAKKSKENKQVPKAKKRQLKEEDKKMLAEAKEKRKARKHA